MYFSQGVVVNLIEKFFWYRREYGLRAALLRIFNKLSRRSAPIDRDPAEQFIVQEALASDSAGVSQPTAAQLVKGRFGGTAALPIFEAPGPRLRLNLVTDSINSGSLFGGVGTAIILSVLLAKRTGAILRVVTRTQSPHQSSVMEVLRCNGIEYAENIEFSFIDVADPNSQLDVCSGDYFLTTSWWTTASTLGSIAPKRVIYLLQEDERMFYPYGDDWVRCSETISRQDIAIVLNTKLLRDHLIANGLPHLEEAGMFFEPAFPMLMSDVSTCRDVGAENARSRLFFYARPNNLRNLFYRGIEALDEAVCSGVIDSARWEIVLVGKDVPQLTFGGVRPTIMPTLSWSDYNRFVRTIDIGFCLMATPHPSYPPLDLAAAGAMVVTNRFGVKQSLSNYSPLISTVELDKRSLVDGLRKAIECVERANKPIGKTGLFKSWEQSLVQVIEALANDVLR